MPPATTLPLPSQNGSPADPNAVYPPAPMPPATTMPLPSENLVVWPSRGQKIAGENMARQVVDKRLLKSRSAQRDYYILNTLLGKGDGTLRVHARLVCEESAGNDACSISIATKNIPGPDGGIDGSALYELTMHFSEGKVVAAEMKQEAVSF
ncbi:MAG: hypothetical protein WC421_03160 [Elusimicrobiales bacterium]